MSYKLLERRFYHLGVSASQARVLAVLHFSDGPIKPSLVATLLFQETQSITGILHRIESRGWVRRLPDPNDRRAVGLELTDKGREITEEIVKISEELYDDMFGSKVLTATEKRQVEVILQEGARARLQAAGDGLQAPPRAAVRDLEGLAELRRTSTSVARARIASGLSRSRTAFDASRCAIAPPARSPAARARRSAHRSSAVELIAPRRCFAAARPLRRRAARTRSRPSTARRPR